MSWIVMGAGQMARTVASHVRVEAFVVDDAFWAGPDRPLDGVRVLPASQLLGAGESSLHGLLFCPVVSAITSWRRHGLAAKLRAEKFGFRPVVAPGAVVHPTADLWGGAFVNSGAVVDFEAEVGFCALVNRGATVGHQAAVRDFATIGPGAHLAGGVRVGTMATVGMGAVVREGVVIGPSAVVGMGAVVLHDVPAGETWVGNPARRLERG